MQVQRDANALLEEQYAILHAEHQASVSVNNKMLGRLQTAVIGQEKLLDQVKDLEREMARLKKSDRAKGKVWQRNLRLKATLQQYVSRTDLSMSQFDTNRTASLQEALAIASERIEELESNGEALLDALEERDDSEEDRDHEEKAAKLLGSAITFRGVVEDETCSELKEHWRELVDD